MNKKQALQMELTACRIGIRVCMVLSIISALSLEWVAVIASMITMMVCEVARQLVNKQLEGDDESNG